MATKKLKKINEHVELYWNVCLIYSYVILVLYTNMKAKKTIFYVLAYNTSTELVSFNTSVLSLNIKRRGNGYDNKDFNQANGEYAGT